MLSRPHIPLLLLAAGLVPLVSLARDWNQFQGPTGLGISAETGLKLGGWGEDGPPLLWAKELNEGFGGAAVVGDEVFLVDRVPGEADRLLCLALAAGEEKWSYTFEHPGSLPHPGSRGVPLVEDDAVYFIGGFGQVYRVSRESREADWVVAIQDRYGADPPRWGWAQSPVIAGDVLVVPAMAEEVGLVGLDKKTGEELWRTEGFGNSHSTPTLITLHGVEQAVFLAVDRANNAGVTISVVPSTGEVLWKTDAYYNDIPITFPILVDDDRIFLTGGYEDGSCMIRVSPDWEVTKLFEIPQGSQMHPPFVIAGHLYMLANENANHAGEARKTGGLMCLDLDGKVLWNTGDRPFMGRGGMLLVEGKLLIQDGETGYLRVVDPSPEGYRQVAEADIFGKREEVEERVAAQQDRAAIRMPDFKFWSPMALSQGRLIMRGQEHVKCLDLR